MRAMASVHASLYLGPICSLRINEHALQSVCSAYECGRVDTGSR